MKQRIIKEISSIIKYFKVLAKIIIEIRKVFHKKDLASMMFFLPITKLKRRKNKKRKKWNFQWLKKETRDFSKKEKEKVNTKLGEIHFIIIRGVRRVHMYLINKNLL